MFDGQVPSAASVFDSEQEDAIMDSVQPIANESDMLDVDLKLFFAAFFFDWVPIQLSDVGRRDGWCLVLTVGCDDDDVANVC